MNNRKYLGVLGLLGFLGIQPALARDWVGAVWLVWFVWFAYFFMPAAPKDAAGEAINEERAAAKQAAIEKVFAEIQKKGEITNDGVQALLGVSDATAERYLQELESEGRIKQVGEAGLSVSYKVA